MKETRQPGRADQLTGLKIYGSQELLPEFKELFDPLVEEAEFELTEELASGIADALLLLNSQDMAKERESMITALYT